MVNLSGPDAAAAALSEVRDRALQATGAAFMITDASVPERPIVWVNDAFTRTTGYTLAQVRGRSANVLIGPETDLSTIAAFSAAMSAGRSVSGTVVSYRSTGQPFWNHVSLSPIHDDAGRVTHWVANQVDVTDEVMASAAQRHEVEVERQARHELGVLTEISSLLMDLDDPQTLQAIADQLAGGIIDWAGFFLNDGGLHAAAGIDVNAPPSGRRRRHGPGAPRPGERRRPHGPDPVQALLDGAAEKPVDLDLTATYPDRTASTWLVGHLREVLSDRRVTTVVLLPLEGRRRVLGLLAVVPRSRTGSDGLASSTRNVLELTVRRVGLGIDNVRLYAREHAVAETLQRAMLPQQAQVDGVDVWTYYSPNTDHAQIGGDWYDVLQVSPDVVAVVIGDVVGHDVEAAAAMGQLRSVVRAFAYELATPGLVLERVDQVVDGMTIPRAASMVLMTLTHRSGTWHLEYSRAGHLPVMLVRDGHPMLLDEAGGSMIGFGGRPRSTAGHDLLPGDVLVFYTDGLIERRDRPLREGLVALQDLASGITAIDAAGIGEDLIAGLVDRAEDDIAVVVVRLPDHAADGAVHAHSRSARRWVLPSEPASIGRARHAVLRTGRAWNLSDVGSAELVASELVANAVLHGWGPISLRLFDTGDGLRIEVEDANPAPPVTADGHPGRVGGYGMRIVERLADWGWRPLPKGKLVWARMRAVELAGPAERAGSAGGADGPGEGDGTDHSAG